MKRYKAVNGDTAVFLTKTEQIEKFRSAGCKIYEVDEQGRERLVGGPERSIDEGIQVEQRITGGFRNE